MSLMGWLPMTKVQIAGDKIVMALRKVPPQFIPYIIGHMLRRYERYGLADLVEMAWDWKPKEGEDDD